MKIAKSERINCPKYKRYIEITLQIYSYRIHRCMSETQDQTCTLKFIERADIGNYL